jgi:hypothetical protein
VVRMGRRERNEPDDHLQLIDVQYPRVDRNAICLALPEREEKGRVRKGQGLASLLTVSLSLSTYCADISS